MKKLSLIAALALGGLIACSTLVNAQDAPKKGGKRGPSIEQLTTQLSLTDEQKPKVQAVLDETAKKMKDLAPEDRQTKGKEIRDEQNKKMKAILTPEQYTKFQEMRGGKKGGKKAEKKSE
jgi:periplasmic protein CpxP/Spy